MGSRKEGNKGITPVVAIILLLLITISIVGSAFVFFTRTTETTAQAGEEQMTQVLRQAASQLRIEGASGDTVYIRNTGSSNLENINFFADNQIKEISSGPVSLPAGEVGTYKLSGFSAESTGVIKATSGGFSDMATNANPVTAGGSTPVSTPTPTPSPTPVSTPTPTPTPTATPTPTPVSTPTPTPSPTPTPIQGAFKRVFVTSADYRPSVDFNSVATADAKCAERATAASLPGTWRAWISASGVNAKDRISDTTYRRMDNALIANNRADLIDGTIENFIDKDERGLTKANYGVWTGTNSDGTANAATCSGWASSSGAGIIGFTGAKTAVWTNVGGVACSGQFSLFCFEI